MESVTLSSLTLPYLARLVPADYTVSLLDETVRNVDFSEPVDLVAITALTPNALRAYEIADRYRQLGVFVVLGGIHVTTCPTEAAAHADALILGEAEISWPQFLRDFRNGRTENCYQSEKPHSLQNLPHPLRPD